MSTPSEQGPVNDLNRLIKENRVAEFPSPNLALGMVPVAFGRGTSQWRWEHQPAAALNPFGTIQGGYIGIFADEMLATAIASVLEEEEWSMTIEFKLNFLRILKPGLCEGSARVIRRTRSIAFLDAEIRDDAGAVAVTVTSTWSIARR